MWSLEGRDSLERLALPGQVPVLQELRLVEFGPLENVSPRSRREISMDGCGFYLDGNLVFPVYGVEVWVFLHLEKEGYIGAAGP